MWISKRRWEWILSDLDSLKSSYSRLRDEVCVHESTYRIRETHKDEKIARLIAQLASSVRDVKAALKALAPGTRSK